MFEVKKFATASSAFSIPGHGLQDLLRHDRIENEEGVNVTGLNSVLNVLSTEEIVDLEEISLARQQGFGFTPDGGNGLIYIHRDY